MIDTNKQTMNSLIDLTTFLVKIYKYCKGLYNLGQMLFFVYLYSTYFQ